MTNTASQTFTIEQYLELEANSATKYEYRNGKIVEIPGRTTLDNQLTGKVITQLNNAIDVNDATFQVYNSGIKIWVERYNCFIYPDTAVVRLKPDFYKQHKETVTNPLLIIKVTSLNLGGNFNMYRSIPSFQEYIFVSQEQHHVARYFREEVDLWRISDYYDLEDMIPLQSMGLEIPMMGIYKGVDLNP